MHSLTFSTSFLPLNSFYQSRSFTTTTSQTRRPYPSPHHTNNTWLKTAPYLHATIQRLVATVHERTASATTAIFSPYYNPQKNMFRRLRQSAGQASNQAWLEDQERNKDEWKRRITKNNNKAARKNKARSKENNETSPTQANFTGSWRLNSLESDSLWSVCRKLGCPWFVRPFIDSSYLSLVTIVKHNPNKQTWHEEMIKARCMSFDNDLITDGSPEVWPSTFDPDVKVHLNTWCDEDGGIITVLEHKSQNAVQRLTRRINESSDVVMITNVFSFMNEDGVIETSVHRSKFDRE